VPQPTTLQHALSQLFYLFCYAYCWNGSNANFAMIIPTSISSRPVVNINSLDYLTLQTLHKGIHSVPLIFYFLGGISEIFLCSVRILDADILLLLNLRHLLSIMIATFRKQSLPLDNVSCLLWNVLYLLKLFIINSILLRMSSLINRKCSLPSFVQQFYCFYFVRWSHEQRTVSTHRETTK
jgi:hypothetical protein